MFPDNHSLLNNLHTYGINLDKREIYLHGYYSQGEDPGVEFKMATTFIKNLHLLESDSHDGILIHMHTGGGEWSDGISIFNAIEFCPCPITILVYGEGVSMGSIILQAADNRILMPDTDFMVHFGEISLEGGSLGVESSVALNKRNNLRMLKIYARKCVGGFFFRDMREEHIKRYLERKINKLGDWWMTSYEAMHYGFADAVLGNIGYESIDIIRKNV